MADERVAKRFFVSGNVQGVGFRFFARRAAERLGLAGYTKNLRDGRVEVYVVGASDLLEALRSELHRGPRTAQVSAIVEERAPIDPRFAQAFSIEYEI